MAFRGTDLPGSVGGHRRRVPLVGLADYTIVARLFRDVRPFRIYDGPSEVHRRSMTARSALSSSIATPFAMSVGDI
jgi:alkylation response protein AidB-like acyl-CoA dehydrogenase